MDLAPWSEELLRCGSHEYVSESGCMQLALVCAGWPPPPLADLVPVVTTAAAQHLLRPPVANCLSLLFPLLPLPLSPPLANLLAVVVTGAALHLL